MSLSELSIKDLYRRLLKQSIVYTGGAWLQQATAFLLLPIYLRFLTPDDLGILALGGLLSSLLAGFLGLGTYAAVTRFYWQWKQQGIERRAAGSLWLVTCLFAFGITLILQAWGEPLTSLLVSQLAFSPYVRVVLWTTLFSVASQGPLALLRIREEAGVFVRWSYFTWLARLLLTIYFVAVAREGALGALKGGLVAAILSAVAGAWLMRGRVTFELKLAEVKESLRFSLPLVPTVLFDSALGGLDRFFLDKFVPLSQIGLFNVAARIADAGVRLLAYSSFKTAWIPFATRLNIERQDGPARTARFGTLIVAGAACLGLVTVLFAREALILFGRQTFLAAATYVPILVLANLALVLDLLAGVGFLMSKQTRYATPLVGLQFTLAMALNWALVPRIGPMGAALASLISLTAMVGLKFAVAQRYYPIPYDWKRILGFLVIAVGVGMVTQGLVQALDPSLIAGLVVKLVGLGLYVLAAGWLVLGRITTQKMAATLQQIVSLVQQT